MDIGVGQPNTLVLDLGSCRVVRSITSPWSSPPGWVLLHCPDKFATYSNEQGGRGSSPAFKSSRSELLHLYLWAQLYCVAKEWHRDHSLKYCSWWGALPALPPAFGIDGWWGHAVTRQISHRYSCPMLTSSGLAHPYFYQWDWLYCAANASYRTFSHKFCSWWQAGAALLTLWPQSQLSHITLSMMVWGGKRASAPCPWCHRTDE